jgi:hypothetical protein
MRSKFDVKFCIDRRDVGSACALAISRWKDWVLNGFVDSVAVNARPDRHVGLGGIVALEFELAHRGIACVGFIAPEFELCASRSPASHPSRRFQKSCPSCVSAVVGRVSRSDRLQYVTNGVLRLVVVAVSSPFSDGLPHSDANRIRSERSRPSPCSARRDQRQ